MILIRLLTFFGFLFGVCTRLRVEIAKAQFILAENLVAWPDRDYAKFLVKRIAKELTADKKEFGEGTISK